MDLTSHGSSLEQEASSQLAPRHYAQPRELGVAGIRSGQWGQSHFYFPNAKAQGYLPSSDSIRQKGDVRLHPSVAESQWDKITFVNSFFLARKIQNKIVPLFLFF